MSTPTDPDPPIKDDRSERMDYTEAITGGTVLHDFWGGKVIEYTHPTTGALLALKVKPRSGLHRSEAILMHYAATHGGGGVRAPKVHGVYDVQTRPRARVMVSERVPGAPLAEIWGTATQAERESYKAQLREQLAKMRRCTQPFIGRVSASGEATPTYNLYDRLLTTYMGPFHDETEFDEWLVKRGMYKTGLVWRIRMKRFMEREKQRQQQQREASGDGGGKFVLTHGDLAPRNIMAKDGVITGIIDWGRGGFFPEYAEYAFAMELSPGIEKWWIPVLKEILEPCSSERLKLTKLAEDRGW